MLEAPSKTALAFREIDPIPDPLAAFERLRGGGHAWLLDSAIRSARLGRYTFLGADPYAVVRVRGRSVELEVLRADAAGRPWGRHSVDADPLAALRSLLPRRPDGPPSPVPFAGGAVGFFGYELACQFDVHRLHGRDDLGLPDAVFLLVDRVLALDHESDRAFVCGLGLGAAQEAARTRADAAAADLAAQLRDRSPTSIALAPHAMRGARHDLDPAAYAKAVDAIKEEIAAGNVYQACLSARVARPFDGDPWSLYRALRRVNPAPFAAFVELPEVSIASSSPERFLRVDAGGNAESRPIKGTARRGRDPVDDDARRAALSASEKDRAENLMIVDLVRNDLGRVCETASVHVAELMAIEDYASVFQMVSTVRGRLGPGRDALDAVAATFPPGSMTGAPKIAAMQLLDRLETYRRAAYAGALGYLDARGGADLSVVIRSLFVQRGRAFLHAGGGVVSDSDPIGEYHEALDKLAPMSDALREAGRGDAPL